ncbi:ArnT family glycosyltransferase [Amphiplicatus metriothermophilus]|uniref:4-amino-4-deoxy-L-arabinose transferase n=1 Tax=Amphiplicatus metriothermophilus TaxID=1519374 RepID=A0A239PJE5_9PROT|nr:glycosyltransferase family 39 protein [Amphiplicatus metriothermophilus]MBB5517921.1 4-amino-4-deoxy-L-arabinose transferase-like glycosyltransferase [Amphiplicatus metriothermophilus]SNT67745.1 4-amino-4-deoxy-L-arabinose transferase [Amphiplicatus metriothermophilus]
MPTRTAQTLTGDAFRLCVVAFFAAVVAFAGLRTLPPLDRDEARFAQATAQMLETGDFVTIRFQDDERNKKPAGIHWLQAASVSVFSTPEAREIWAYRLPSMLGAVLAAVFTYLAGARLYGPATGFLGALLLAAAPLSAGEATIAKTDAALLAAIVAAQCALVHVFGAWKDRQLADGAARRVWPLVFWIALGASALLKGPIGPMIVGFTGAALFARWPRLEWIRALRPGVGLAILALMIGPWAVAIGHATEGRFYAEAMGGDMLGKVGTAQESHGGPPGYHLALVWLLFWPGAALLIPATLLAVATRRAWPAWLLIGWIAPAWLVFELAATKLPHYALPLYPALAILAARAASLGAGRRRPIARRAGAIVYGAVGLAFAACVAVLPFLFGATGPNPFVLFSAAAIALASLYAASLFWRGRCLAGAYAACLLGVFLAWTVLDGALPQLDRLKVSPNISAALDEADRHPLRDGAPPVALAGYYEPSAVFLLGTRTRLTDGAGAAGHLFETPGAAAVVEDAQADEFHETVKKAGVNARALAVVEGLNYSNGRTVRLTIYVIES